MPSRLIAVALLLLLVFSSTNHPSAFVGQVVSPEEPPLILRLHTASGWLADVRVKDGGVARVSIDGQPGIGLRVTRQQAGDVILDVIDFGVDAGGDLAVVATATLSVGSHIDLHRWVDRALEATWIHEGDAKVAGACADTDTTQPFEGATPSPQRPCSTCCVTCDGVTVCSCHVVSACGSCCCPTVCDC